MNGIAEAKEFLERSREGEVLDWYRMSPEERFAASLELRKVFDLFGGSYEPGPDTQSPFHIRET